jgi:hypothetical protein
MSFEFELHGEFETEFQNTLVYETGVQMGTIDEKKVKSRKSRAKGPLISYYIYLEKYRTLTFPTVPLRQYKSYRTRSLTD